MTEVFSATAKCMLKRKKGGRVKYRKTQGWNGEREREREERNRSSNPAFI